MSSNKKLSIAIISILILSAFTTTTAPTTSAISDPYIIVYPSSVSPGQTVYVRGYNFESGETVEIYCDVVDEYHHLGSEVVNWFGRFYFSFVMQEGYPGTCNIIAVTNPDGTYSEDIELSYTNPLDQRLVDLIGSLSPDIEAKLDTILERLGTAPSESTGSIWGDIDRINTEVMNIEGKLDGTVSSLITTIDTKLDRLGTPGSAPLDTVFNALSAIYDGIDDIWTLEGSAHEWANLATALDDIKNEITTIKVKTDTINWVDITSIGNWLIGWFGSGGTYSKTEQIYVHTDYLHFGPGWDTYVICDTAWITDKPAKMTITIITKNINAEPDEGLEIIWQIGKEVEAGKIVTHGHNVFETYEFCFYGKVSLKGFGTNGFDVYYDYVVEYQP